MPNINDNNINSTYDANSSYRINTLRSDIKYDCDDDDHIIETRNVYNVANYSIVSFIAVPH